MKTRKQHTPTCGGHSPCVCGSWDIEPQHTPTPWKLASWSPTLIVSESEGRHLANMNDVEVRHRGDKEPQTGSIANAAFIVRAVNSHEELIGMLKVYRNELMAKATTTGEKGYLNMYQLVDKAIAKAKGK